MMIDITAEQVAKLGDRDLRELIGRLCEAEVRRRGISPSVVTWGGEQDARDGGLDVRVEIPSGIAIDGFVPRGATGFQVKKTDMPRGEILKEMCPGGSLRSVIRELADRRGAYVMVSSRGSTADGPLQERLGAMREAVESLANASEIALRFYDRGQLATWVREHPGLMSWVREKVGEPFQGWRPYGQWAYSLTDPAASYLFDDRIRVRSTLLRAQSGTTALDAMAEVRNRLRTPGEVVRLVGLSGVGKTAFAQALFDDRIGQFGLDPSLALYADIADRPDPDPREAAVQFLAEGKRAIIVLDNCGSDLHRRVGAACRVANSTVSLITIEYDIREDLSEGTEVFTLEPSSPELVGRIIRRQYPQVSELDARRIADWSGGNARIALALAAAVGKDENISSLKDAELFERLFRQRNNSDSQLLSAAQALSLPYSFQGENISSDQNAELCRLGRLVDLSAGEMFRHVADLADRGLVQRRSEWRAVLPHAVANHLAADALKRIPAPFVKNELIQASPRRLLKSFARRLGYLHDNEQARDIVREWLTDGGLLGDLQNLDDDGFEMFYSVAPVILEETLTAIERSVSKNGAENFRRFSGILRSLAYDAALFDRASNLLARIAASCISEGGDVAKEQRRILGSLFFIRFSGTHASVEQRVSVATRLLRSKDAQVSKLGVTAFRALLEANYFGPALGFDFGQRSRDYGYWPEGEQISLWFGTVLRALSDLAASDTRFAGEIRALIGRSFKGLWAVAGVRGSLERVCDLFSRDQHWVDGWVAVRATIHSGSTGFRPEERAQLDRLEMRMRPRDIVERVRSVVLSREILDVGISAEDDGPDNVSKAWGSVHAESRQLGALVARDATSLEALLADLVRGSTDQLWNFGWGLAEASESEYGPVWSRLVSAYASSSPEVSSPLLRGFLYGVYQARPDVANALLDSAVEDPALGWWYPFLQGEIPLDRQGFDRLMRSLTLGLARVHSYRRLCAGRMTATLPGSEFNELVRAIAARPSGHDTALEILYSRLYPGDSDKSSEDEIIEIGCELIGQLPIDETRGNLIEYRLRVLGGRCLVGEQGASAVRTLCSRLKVAVTSGQTYAFYHGALLDVLLESQPMAALEALTTGGREEFLRGMAILDSAERFGSYPLDRVDEAELVRWCEEDPTLRCDAVASAINPIRGADGGGVMWAPLVRKLVDRSPDKAKTFRVLARAISPRSWSGSRTAVIESNSVLLDEFAEYPDEAVRSCVSEMKSRVAEMIEGEAKFERCLEVDSADSASFE